MSARYTVDNWKSLRYLLTGSVHGDAGPCAASLGCASSVGVDLYRSADGNDVSCYVPCKNVRAVCDALHAVPDADFSARIDTRVLIAQDEWSAYEWRRIRKRSRTGCAAG